MNPEFDTLIEKYMVTTAERERAPLLAEIVHHMTDQVTILDLWYNTEAIAVGTRLVNVVNKKTSGANQAWNAHEWDVR
jgi:ABC-type transport system substrate-binding protein